MTTDKAVSLAEEILVFHEDADAHADTTNQLRKSGYSVSVFDSSDRALTRISPEWPGIVLSCINGSNRGVEFVQSALDIDPKSTIVLSADRTCGDNSLAAITDKVYDVVPQPCAEAEMLHTLKRAMEQRNRTLRERGNPNTAVHDPSNVDDLLLGESQGMRRLREMIASLSQTDADVLIIGETGTGKDLVARSLHNRSQRSKHPFVAINSGALPDSILENELFGHEPGAFTSARKVQVGKFEHASGGTLFLDEIESMPLSVQVKLLRVLEQRVIERLGSTRIIPLDIRVIAATKFRLETLVEKQTFRDDLFYRINVVTIPIPPLRERKEDIPLLFEHFLKLACDKHHREKPNLSRDQFTSLLTHSWPGNVRELRNEVEKFVLLGHSLVTDGAWLAARENDHNAFSLREQLAAYEKFLITQELSANRGNIRATHDALGLPRKTLYDKMRRYGLRRIDYC